MASVMAAMGKPEAEPLFRHALKVQREVLGERAETATSLHDLGVFLVNEERLGEAETVLGEALSICRLKLPPDAPDVREAVNALCGVLDRQDKRDEARQVRSEFEVPGR